MHKNNQNHFALVVVRVIKVTKPNILLNIFTLCECILLLFDDGMLIKKM